MLRFILVIGAAVISNLVAADVSGRWTGTLETRGSRIPVFVTLRQDGQDLLGTVAMGDSTKPVPIENAVIEDDTVTFDAHENPNRVVKFRLSLRDDLMTGETGAGDSLSRVVLAWSPGFEYYAYPNLDRFYPLPDRHSSPTSRRSVPLLIKGIEPKYTEEARAANIQGTVVLQVDIDPTGNVAPNSIRVVRSLGMGLDEKAIEAVKQCKFRPAYEGRKPIAATTAIEMNLR